MNRKTVKSICRFVPSILAASFLLSTLSFAGTADISNDELFSQLEYRYIGPFGHRVSAVAGISGNPKVYFAGAASGGVWKTTDGGVHWKPVFDDQPVQSIGSLASGGLGAGTVSLPLLSPIRFLRARFSG